MKNEKILYLKNVTKNIVGNLVYDTRFFSSNLSQSKKLSLQNISERLINFNL